jgi:mannose/cellobiose epimerase-like protein (N-acyl-D-glucosamine 2-epimerase family)
MLSARLALIRAQYRAPMSTLLQAQRISSSLRGWLLDYALPLWWSHGADHELGGFHEGLHQDATPTGKPRRSRLHPRQIYAFALGPELGWSEHASAAAVRHALQFYFVHYRRNDWLFRKLVATDGNPLDTAAELYDQAFALLGLASAYKLLHEANLHQSAVQLLEAINKCFGRSDRGFNETPGGDIPLLSNSHMHLFEAALAWLEIDSDVRWKDLAEHLVALARSHFIDPNTGFLLEFFDAHWQPLDQVPAQRVEPGHQFEWAWLLLRWSTLTGDAEARSLALALVEQAEAHGVDRARRVAINSLTPTGTVLDPEARLWPQTERLKATLLAAEITQDARQWLRALESARTLALYLDVPRVGLWKDKQTAAGDFVDEPAPASSLYHIASAIAQMERTVQRRQ